MTVRILIRIIICLWGVRAMAGEAMIYAETEFTVGAETTLESASPENNFMVVFEDDGATGYLYGLDTGRSGNPILDALHIYNVQNVTDKNIPSKAQIVWSGDGLKALLLINGYAHAVFNFEARRAYCRTNFPPPDKKWTQFDHAWDEGVLKLFE